MGVDIITVSTGREEYFPGDVVEGNVNLVVTSVRKLCKHEAPFFYATQASCMFTFCQSCAFQHS